MLYTEHFLRNRKGVPGFSAVSHVSLEDTHCIFTILWPDLDEREDVDFTSFTMKKAGEKTTIIIMLACK